MQSPPFNQAVGHFKRSNKKKSQRQGAIVVLAALLMLPLMAMLAFSIDLGYVANVQTELKRSADAAALAGAGAIVNGRQAAIDTAYEYAGKNPVGNRPLEEADVEVEIGEWDQSQRVFTPTKEKGSAVKVTAHRNDQPYFFARVLGQDRFSTKTSAIATYRPRDIMVVLDYSASMNDDSEVQSIAILGRAIVEANQRQIYQELGSPEYGIMKYEPEFLTLTGQPARGNIPQISVEFRGNRSNKNVRDVYVTSTMPITKVEFNNNSRNSQTGNNSRARAFNFSSNITQVKVFSGSNNGEVFQYSVSSTIQGLGLNGVPYPFPGGSWSEYVSYVRGDTANGYNDDFLRPQDLQHKYGMQTWVNYLLRIRPSAVDTPVLWETSHQPLTALKDAVRTFFAYLEEVETDDRVGLVAYNSRSEDALLESPLTDNFAKVEDISRKRQAGHYNANTNIGAGLRVAREELEKNARPGALKMIVLITDGIANRPTNESTARNYLLQQANLTAQAGIPVVAISLGSGADHAVMATVADRTSGAAFSIPGGQTASQYEEDLKNVFRKIADERPLRLVD